MLVILKYLFNIWLVCCLFNGIFLIRNRNIMDSLCEQDGLKEHGQRYVETLVHIMSIICAPFVTTLIFYTYIKIYILVFYRILLIRLIILLTRDKKTEAEFRQILKNIKFNDSGEKKEIVIDETEEDDGVQ